MENFQKPLENHHQYANMYMYAMKELALVLEKAGIPSVQYEGSMGDKTDLDEVLVFDQVDVFMESQGLRKLEE